MLVSLYLKLHTKIQITRYTLQGNHPSRLGILRLAKLFLLEWILLITKYLLLILKHPSESFKILVNQPALAVCPYSYTDHKSFQKKVRVFSLGGLTALIGATIISSLILNLSTGPIFQSKAATYTFIQTNWSGGATVNNATHTSNQSGWNEYSAKDANLTTVNSGADLQLSTTSSQTTQTSDTDYNTGTLSNTAVSGTGDSADLVLSTVAHINEYTIGALANINVDATAVTDNSNGTWTITLGTADLSRIFKNDKFKDEASPQKSWKILSSFDSANKIIVWDSEGNGGAPSAAGATQATVGRWYASISLWEAGRRGDLVTRNAIERGLPYYDGTVDTTQVFYGTWITDATHYFEIYVSLGERHTGVRNTGYRLERSYPFSGPEAGFYRINGLAVKDSAYIALMLQTSGQVVLSNMLIYDSAAGGILLGGSGSYYISNSIILNSAGSGIITNSSFNSGTAYVYNTTIAKNSTYGINWTAGTFYTKNVYSGSNTSGDYNGSITKTTSASSDATGSAGLQNIAYSNTTGASFVNITAGSENLHLNFNSSLKDQGTDLSGDSYPITTDIDQDTRSGTWDIGADDVGAALVKVHSIGTATRNFATLQGWEDARDGVLTTRNVFKTTGQLGGAFAAGQIIKGCTSAATGTYIPEQDTPSATETYMTLDSVTGTFQSETVMVSTDSCATPTGPRATLSTILTTAGTIERGEAYKDTTFTASVTIDNSTTDATHYMWLTAAPGSRHTGVAGTGMLINNASVGIADGWTIVDWVEVSGGSIGINSVWDNRIHNTTIRNNIVHDYTVGGGALISNWDDGNWGHSVYNNILYNLNQQNWTNGGLMIFLGSNNIYNNTLYNSTKYGIQAWTIFPVASNNIVMNTSGAAFWITSMPGSSNNISPDTSAPGANSLTNQTLAQVAFVSTTPGIEDFHLLPASVAKDAGTSLSSTFTTDIDSQTRPYGSTWDIGADEWVSSTAGNFSGTYASASLDSTAQNIISATLTKTDSVGTGSIAYELSNDGGTTYASVTAGSAYTFTTTGSNLKARATLTSTDSVSPPSLDDITVSYTYYPVSQTLTSSVYNSTDSANIIGSLAWAEDASLPTGATVTTSLRAASSSAGLSSASWNDFTNSTTNCSKTTVTVTCPLAASPLA